MRIIEVEGGYRLVVKTVKELKKDEWFTLKPLVYPKDTQVYARGDYDRAEKKYECSKWWDACSNRYFKGDREVYTDFFF